MCVCMYVCMYVYPSASAQVARHATSMYVCVCICVYIYIYRPSHISYTLPRTPISPLNPLTTQTYYIPLYVCASLCMCMYVYVCTRAIRMPRCSMPWRLAYLRLHDALGSCSSQRKGSAPERGRHSTIFLPPNASVQWQPDGLTIHTEKWLLGAGFLGSPPIT